MIWPDTHTKTLLMIFLRILDINSKFSKYLWIQHYVFKAGQKSIILNLKQAFIKAATGLIMI